MRANIDTRLPIRVAAVRKAPRVLLTVLLSALGLVLLSGCVAPGTGSPTAPRPYTTPTSLPGGDPSPGMGFDTKAGATCGVLSVIATNLINALEEHKRGTLSDTSYATIINTVTPDLLVIGGLAGYHLQGEIKNLNSAISKSPPTIVGAHFDAESDVFVSAFGRASQKCHDNDSPLSISSTTG
ncbi:hypothetical protein [Lacisediminihabitans sp.]|uniref:hypothetical protein n=1 Tax=Lacisediminihabitans sp. TaxID=2787631 RepID=UPI00374CE086